MNRHGRILSVALPVLAAAAPVGSLYRSQAQDRAAAGRPQGKPDSPELAVVRKTAGEFAGAFDRGDARAVAAFWTRDGEYVGPDGEAIRGRAAIEKEYGGFSPAEGRAAFTHFRADVAALSKKAEAPAQKESKR
jgi:hypothetical protein